VDSAGHAAMAGLTVDKMTDDLVTASLVKTQAVVTYTGKLSGEQRRWAAWRDHSGSAVIYTMRTAARRGRARSGSVASDRLGRTSYSHARRRTEATWSQLGYGG
jgi:hypothetical protein